MAELPEPPPDLEEPLLLPLEVDDVEDAGDGEASLRPGDADEAGRVDTVTGEVTDDGGALLLLAVAEDLVAEDDELLRSCGEDTEGARPAGMLSYLQLLLTPPGLSSPLGVCGAGPGPGLVGMWCWRCVRW